MIFNADGNAGELSLCLLLAIFTPDAMAKALTAGLLRHDKMTNEADIR